MLAYVQAPLVPRAPPRAVAPTKGFLGSMPTAATFQPFRGARDTLRMMARLAHGDRGEKSLLVRQLTEWVTRYVQPKDYLGEILAIRNCLVQPSPLAPDLPMLRYTNDPRHVEWIKDPHRIVEEILQHGSSVVDCDEIALLAATMAMQVGREAQFVALGFGSGQLTHVGTRAKEPKSDTWIWMDAVAGPREREAAATAKEVLFWPLD